MYRLSFKIELADNLYYKLEAYPNLVIWKLADKFYDTKILMEVVEQLIIQGHYPKICPKLESIYHENITKRQ